MCDTLTEKGQAVSNAVLTSGDNNTMCMTEKGQAVGNAVLTSGENNTMCMTENRSDCLQCCRNWW